MNIYLFDRFLYPCPPGAGLLFIIPRRPRHWKGYLLLFLFPFFFCKRVNKLGMLFIAVGYSATYLYTDSYTVTIGIYTCLKTTRVLEYVDRFVWPPIFLKSLLWLWLLLFLISLMNNQYTNIFYIINPSTISFFFSQFLYHLYKFDLLIWFFISLWIFVLGCDKQCRIIMTRPCWRMSIGNTCLLRCDIIRF